MDVACTVVECLLRLLSWIYPPSASLRHQSCWIRSSHNLSRPLPPAIPLPRRRTTPPHSASSWKPCAFELTSHSALLLSLRHPLLPLVLLPCHGRHSLTPTLGFATPSPSPWSSSPATDDTLYPLPTLRYPATAQDDPGRLPVGPPSPPRTKLRLSRFPHSPVGPPPRCSLLYPTPPCVALTPCRPSSPPQTVFFPTDRLSRAPVPTVYAPDPHRWSFIATYFVSITTAPPTTVSLALRPSKPTFTSTKTLLSLSIAFVLSLALRASQWALYCCFAYPITSSFVLLPLARSSSLLFESPFSVEDIRYSNRLPCPNVSIATPSRLRFSSSTTCNALLDPRL
ncbi:hypothetical protein B0H11DRAFT_2241802 [Mycena galericulata]|nr:hypothetical protein B0H11DRAFT_2241802 [Mycena galericulata]